MQFFMQLVINGIVQGSMIAILAIGLAMMYSILRLVNFAYGEIYMLGAYFCWMSVNLITDNYWIGVLVAIVGGIVVGFLMEQYCFRPVYGRPGINMFIISLGLVMLLQEGGTFIWTGFPKNLSTPYLEATTIGPYVISVQRIIVVIAALLIVGALLSFLQLTKTGKSMRALAANRQAAFLVGIDVPRTTTLAFIIGSCIGSISGALLGPLFMLIPVMGSGMNIKSLIVILFGGLGSIGGAMIGAYILGMAESMFAGYLWLEWTGAVGYLMLIATLYLRPRGLFGKEQ